MVYATTVESMVYLLKVMLDGSGVQIRAELLRSSGSVEDLFMVEASKS